MLKRLQDIENLPSTAKLKLYKPFLLVLFTLAACGGQKDMVSTEKPITFKDVEPDSFREYGMR